MVMWAVNSSAAAFLLLLLAVRKNHKVYPAFTFYIALNMLLGGFLVVLFLSWGVTSRSWLIGWAMQGLVVFTRALAIAEIFRHVLARFPGIWALAIRLLAVCAAVVLLYSGLGAWHQWKSAVPSADRAVELAIAAGIVVLLLFARYYNVPIEPVDRSLAIGFCLYSCFFVLNNTVVERYLYDYQKFWVRLEQLAYLATLVIWSSALWKARTATEQERLLSPGVYQSLGPQINLRLRELDDQLRTWKVGVSSK